MFFSRRGVSQALYTSLVSSFRSSLVSLFFIFLLGLTWDVQAAVPVVSLTAPATAYVNEVVLVDARQSTSVSKRPQSDGNPSVTIDFGDGFSANLLASGHAYRVPGSYTMTLTAKDSTGAMATVQRVIVVSAVPAATGSDIQIVLDTGNPVLNGNNLQAAINLAATRNTSEQEIILPAGAVFAGPIVLPTPVGGKYITIRGSGLSSLPVGDRVSPSSGRLMPVITAPSSTTVWSPALGTTIPAPASPPHHYRLQGLHLQKDDETKPAATLMNIGIDSGGGQTLISQLTHHFIIDRCWFDGGASDTSQTTNGLRIYGNYVSVIDSYFGDFRLIGSGVDAAAISLTYGQGPYAFWNNTMVATSENFCIAGGPAEANSGVVSNATTTSATLSAVTNLEVDQNIALKVGGSYGPDQTTIIRSISGNNVTFDPIPTAPDNGSAAQWIAMPSFIEFRRNYLYKPLSWRPSDPSWNGQNYQIKNLFETKFSRYLLMDGNVFQNQWISAQDYAITFTPRNQYGAYSPAAVVREIQFSNNILRNAANGMVILPSDTEGGAGNVSQRTSDITLRNNLFWNVGINWDSTCCSHMLINLLSGLNPSDISKRIFIIHNTHDNGTPNNSNGLITDFGAQGGATESLWLNNVHQDGGYGFRSNFTVSDSAANIRRFLPPGGPNVWNRNLIANIGSANYPARPQGLYPSGSWVMMFVNYAAGDFTLRQGNPGKNAATDGTDIGVDMNVLRSATLHTVDGRWPGSTQAPSAEPTPAAVRPRFVRPHKI
jgi:PKD repeat protein